MRLLKITLVVAAFAFAPISHADIAYSSGPQALALLHRLSHEVSAPFAISPSMSVLTASGIQRNRDYFIIAPSTSDVPWYVDPPIASASSPLQTLTISNTQNISESSNGFASINANLWNIFSNSMASRTDTLVDSYYASPFTTYLLTRTTANFSFIFASRDSSRMDFTTQGDLITSQLNPPNAVTPMPFPDHTIPLVVAIGLVMFAFRRRRRAI